VPDDYQVYYRSRSKYGACIHSLTLGDESYSFFSKSVWECVDKDRNQSISFDWYWKLGAKERELVYFGGEVQEPRYYKHIEKASIRGFDEHGEPARTAGLTVIDEECGRGLEKRNPAAEGPRATGPFRRPPGECHCIHACIHTHTAAYSHTRTPCVLVYLPNPGVWWPCLFYPPADLPDAYFRGDPQKGIPPFYKPGGWASGWLRCWHVSVLFETCMYPHLQYVGALPA
jgi:hypothetical protein